MGTGHEPVLVPPAPFRLANKEEAARVRGITLSQNEIAFLDLRTLRRRLWLLHERLGFIFPGSTGSRNPYD